jgi:hypothetical protein
MPIKTSPELEVPSMHRWRTTDDGNNRRRRRAPLKEKAPPRTPQPADPARDFATAAHERVNGALVRCEERYPSDAPHSVLYLVVERDAWLWREQLAALHQEFFGRGHCDPLAPVCLEVIDRATEDALQRLIDLGLVARTVRSSRLLWPDESVDASLPAPLSPAEIERLSAYRQRGARKLKMAQVLSGAGLDEEARSALVQAFWPLGCALAVENRLPEPASLNDALLPPLSQHWKDALPLLREFAAEGARPCQPVLEALAPFAQSLS